MIRAFKFLFSPHPAYMIFWVTRACNLACAHCFNRCAQKTAEKDLSLNEIERISGNMGHVKYLTLAGGEPMLRWDLAAVARAFYANNDLHMLNLVTNGWHTDRILAFARDVLGSCPGLHLSVGVSLDGPRDVHDRFRGRAGSYDRAVQTLTKLQALARTTPGLTVAACGTCHAGNESHLPALARFVQNELKTPYYAGLIRGGNLPDMDLKNITADQFKSVSDAIGFERNVALAPNYPFRHVRIAVDQLVSEIIHKSLTQNRKSLTCKAGKKGFVLTSDGYLLLCEILNIRLGNVRDHDYRPCRVLGLASSRDAMARMRRTGCHCTWECFQRLNVVFSPQVYPGLLQKILRNVL